MIYYFFRFMIRSGEIGEDLFLLLITGYAAWNLIDPSPQIIFGGPIAGVGMALIRFFAKIFHWMVLPIIAYFAVGIFVRGFKSATKTLQAYMHENELLPLDEAPTTLDCLRSFLFWYVVGLHTVKAILLLAIVWHSGVAEYDARGGLFTD